jgi:hypothetical protein
MSTVMENVDNKNNLNRQNLTKFENSSFLNKSNDFDNSRIKIVQDSQFINRPLNEDSQEIKKNYN